MRKVRWWSVMFALAWLTGCDAVRPVTTPIPMQFYSSDGPSNRLVIFLPGLGDEVGAFERAGFVELLFASTDFADAVVPDAHLGYYLDRSIDERIYRDILLPYERQGYSEFLVVGVSLGGLGAIRLRHEFGSRVSGIVLIAPFLGNRSVVDAIQHAGDIRTWRRQLGDRQPDVDENIWVMVEDLINQESDEIECTIIAFGTGDKFERANRLLGQSIPEEMSFTANGGHNWTTWSSLWADILQSEGWERLGRCADEVQSARPDQQTNKGS